VLGFFEKLGELSGGTFGVSADEIFDNATGTVVALCTLEGERNGRQRSFDTVRVWQFVDGKATTFREYNAEQAALDAFWS
jgi:ketosteroid isomerase-like protein